MEENTDTDKSIISGNAKSAAPDYWGWLTTAQQNVKEFVEVAGKVTQEKAALLVKQAEEMRQNYDMELATSILMGTVGGPIDPTGHPVPLRRGGKLTQQAIKDLDMTYVTENIISMSFPCDFESGKGTQSGNDIDVVSVFLKKRHEGRFMIWNISEEGYDYGKFSDQVLEYKFPGHPSPPLGLLFKICTSVESWLDADERNVAIIHCLTGKGRTAALVACVMTWIGEFSSPMEALQYMADRRKISVENLTIPSQRRYIQYFSNMLDGVKPRSEPLLLRRVIINSIPTFGSDTAGEKGNLGCCPYVQLFKNGKLIATAAAQGDSTGSSTSSTANDKMQLRWIKASDGSASFNIDCPVQGDILLRCRHVASSGVRVSMFRTAFHTGYVPSGVLRLTKAQLDGSSTDPRFDEDFFVDLIFSPIQAAANISAEDINTSSSVPSDSVPVPPTTATATLAPPSASDSGLLLEASSADRFEATLHRDAKFWDQVASRKQKAKKRKSRKFLSSQQERFSIADDLRMDDDSSATEVNFYSSFTTGSGGGGGGASTGGAGAGSGDAGKAYSNLSDLDLIMQLAELESGVSSEEFSFVQNNNNNNSTAAISSTSTSSSFSAVEAGTPSGSETSKGTSKSTSKAPASELQVLEELERELGLDNFLAGISTGDSSKAGAGGGGGGGGGSSAGVAEADASSKQSASSVAASLLSDDDNLDELEKYLQSLGSPAGKPK